MRWLNPPLAIICAAVFTASTVPFARAQQDAAWEEKVMGEVTLESNLPVKVGPDPSVSMPAAQRDRFVSFHVWQAIAADDSFGFSILRMQLKPKLPIDLDRTIKGGMSGALKDIEGADPKFEIEVVKVSGLEARKSSYQGTAPQRVVSVVARDGQTIYQLQIFYIESRTADAQRVLKSLKIARQE